MNSSVDRSAVKAAPTPPAGDVPATETSAPRPCPIPAPSHALQFRAIGLVRGQYVRTEKINQGTIVVEDESQTEIEAVLLGRTIGVVKNHVDLDKPHLWVVYPRTRPKEHSLQLQIVGIWEPETLNPDYLPSEEDTTVESDGEEDDSASDDPLDELPAAADGSAAATDDESEEGDGETAIDPKSLALEEKPKLIPPIPRPVAPPPKIAESSPPQKPPRAVALPEAGGEFSIRGEVVFYSEDSQKVVVKIKQAARQEGDRPKFFKLEMQGKLPTNRALRQFWDLLVRLEGPTLTVIDAVSVAPMKPKKRARPQQPVRRSNQKVISPPQRAGGAPVVRREAADSERPRPKRVIDRPRPRKQEG